MTIKNLECLHKTHFETQCWGQKRPHASSEMDKLTSNTNEEDQIMASVARDLGEDLTAQLLVELNVLLTYRPFQFLNKLGTPASQVHRHFVHAQCMLL